MVRKRGTVVGVALLGLLVIGLAPAAEASSRWIYGSGFRVGGLVFHIGFETVFRPYYGRGGYVEVRRGPYFRVSRRMKYRGRSCNRYCFRDRSHYYHHPGCPLLLSHLGRHRQRFDTLLQRYAPGPGAIYGYRYDDRRYDPYGERYDRYDDDRDDDGYDDR